MAIKSTFLSALKVMMLSVPLALGGCMADGTSDDAAEEDVANDGSDSAEGFFPAGAEVQTIQAEATKAIGVGFATVTCSSGWPGTRGCNARITSPTDIVRGTVSASVDGRDGSVGFTVSQLNSREIAFSASIHEGDAFNPGVNTTRFVVTWIRR